MRHLFNNTFTQKRFTTSYDEYNSPINEWVTVGTIPGRLRVANMQDRFVAASMNVTLEYIFYCAPDVDIRQGDRIELGDTKVEILAVKSPSFAGHHLECEGKTDTRP